jgi:hypothetical protein
MDLKFLVKTGFVHAKAHATAAMLIRRLKIVSLKGKGILLQAHRLP